MNLANVPDTVSGVRLRADQAPSSTVFRRNPLGWQATTLPIPFSHSNLCEAVGLCVFVLHKTADHITRNGLSLDPAANDANVHN
ncbi:hypothetical protein HBI38_182200 [Parastagonospora nodorum]|nr:hypothetical protein HBI09_188190 [Parastagonospora nodorum]KAH4183525.1 hypothetical protein HBH42_205760 [Parastagonospora nodorum]KAH4845453.1 hypothetical protein HBH75_184020 [Parastagonospora nodorum]KAH4994428.1 hypothetical protein HBI77_207720 [Parastagonospora nodorum]KAH5561759.1 hypothetical protein HBI26_191200 [Parastagonospora nodorum]